MVEKTNTEIIEEIITVCDKSLRTDQLSDGLRCECGRAIGERVDLWVPIGRSDTYMIRNTLESMIKYDKIPHVVPLQAPESPVEA